MSSHISQDWELIGSYHAIVCPSFNIDGFLGAHRFSVIGLLIYLCRRKFCTHKKQLEQTSHLHTLHYGFTGSRICDIFRTSGLLGMCALVTKCDLEYWGIDELLLEPCCALRYYPEIELCVKEVEGEEISRKKTKERRQAEDFGPSKIGKIRKYLWNLTEYPETSKAAQVIGIFCFPIHTVCPEWF